ncbi:hypothetical protein DRO26_01035 [Candidatus Bathyarchaeota archaeon]|nr:MAG: hypothetical protein DRO26_01035 [Candidatus Bathyarchaeota archaeon]
MVGVIGSYVPDELIHAEGAVPQHLCRGGELEPVEASSPYIIRFVSLFIKAQFGYYIGKFDALYQMVDMIAIDCVDCVKARLASLFEFFTEIPVTRIGVFSDWDKPKTFS